MSDISGAGLKITIIASATFPQGFTVTEFASDTDPFIVEDVQVTQSEVGVNGDMVSWHRATIIPAEINVIPKTESDKNLKILVNANREAKNKMRVHDDIRIIASYPDGTVTTLKGGVVSEGSIAESVTNDGKIRSKNYKFQFPSVI